MSLARPRSLLKDGVAIRRPFRTWAYIDQHLGLARILRRDLHRHWRSGRFKQKRNGKRVIRFHRPIGKNA